MKKYVSSLFIVAFLLVPLTSVGQTLAELQAQLTQLLEQVAALQSQLAQSQELAPEAPSAVTPSPTITITFSRNLGRGSEGDDVRALQEFLKQSVEIYPEGLVTGYFGLLTERAVQRWQAQENIVSSGSPAATGYGNVGPLTRQKLNESVAPTFAVPAPADPADPADPAESTEPATPDPAPTEELIVAVPDPAEPAEEEPTTNTESESVTPTTPTPPPAPWSNALRVSSQVGDSLASDIASDGENFAIVWGEPIGTMFSLYSAAGSELANTRLSGNGKNPQIAWIGSDYGVLWSETCGLYFTQVSKAGKQLGGNRLVSGDTFEICASAPQLAWNGSGYGVFWHEVKKGIGGKRIYLVFIDQTGSRLTGDIELTSLESEIVGAVWDGSGYGIIWQDKTAQPSTYYFSRLDSAGNKLIPDVLLGNSLGTNPVAWSIAWNNYVYAISARATDASGVLQEHVITLDTSGNIIVSNAQVTENIVAGEEMLGSDLAWGDNVFAMTLQKSDGTIYLAQINAGGTVVSAPTKIEPAKTQARNPSIGWNRARYGISWEDMRDNNGGQEIYFVLEN